MKSKKFSIAEIIIAVMVVAVIALVAVPKTKDLIRKSREGVTKANLGALRSALTLYYANNDGAFPGKDVAQVLVSGGYIKEIPLAFCPGHHGATDYIITGISNIDETKNAGGWAYQPDDTNPERQWGEIWINCSHEDSRGKTWGSY